MASDHLLDAELKTLLSFLPPLNLDRETLPMIRGMIGQRLAGAPAPDLAQVTATVADIPGPPHAPPVRVLCYRPADASSALPAILHMHGGGYVLGSAGASDPANRALAAELNCAVFSVEYRLAPETPYPGPLEDCYAVLAWLHANAGNRGVDPTRIGVKGESAGAGLAAALALLARDRGKLPLAFQHLIYPMIDDRTGADGSSGGNDHVGHYVWTPKQNVFGWSSLLGTRPGGAEVSPYAAPARAKDLAGLPPAFISVGSLDLFLEEDLRYAQRLARAAVPVELHVYPGAFHAFDMAPQTSRVAQSAVRNSREALRKALHG
jgi:acetyl esterase/lipase